MKKENPSVVHCKRTPYDVYIGRPGKWGNPFTVAKEGRGTAIQLHKQWLWNKMQDPQFCEELVEELDGKVLGCWCSPRPCHGDTLVAAVKWLKKRS